MAYKNKKRPAYLQNIVNDANQMLRTLGKDGEFSSLRYFICNLLLKHKCYEGWNFYKMENQNGMETITLAGSSTDFDFIQIY